MTDENKDAFVRRALSMANLDAVRIALVQLTGDRHLEELGPAASLDAAGREQLEDRAAAYLRTTDFPATPPALPDPELRRLMELATGVPMTDAEFESRRGLTAFDEMPWAAQWSNERPSIPDGFSVAVVGAGFSGIAMGVQLARLGIPFTIYERRHEVGGVWSINRYPDARVDTASFTYEFNFEKNYPWSEYYARQEEVQQYLDHVARKHGVWDRIRFGADVVEARFDEPSSTWQLRIDEGGVQSPASATVLVTAVGVFANPLRPDFEGRDEFRGQILHPTEWSEDVVLEGRSVALIGNGSTGVQLAAPLAKAAEQLYVFQRTPQWISPRANYGSPIEPEIRWLLDHLPTYWNWHRYLTAAAQFPTHQLLLADQDWIERGGLVNEGNDKMRQDLIDYIRQQVGDRADLLEQLVPDYAPMTRRPVVDNGWYAALTRDNVELVTSPVRRLVPNGIETADGLEREVDVIVTATGFEVVKYLWPTNYYGVGSADLHEAWSADGPRAYLGMLVPNFPNLFMLYGPNSQPVSGGVSLPSWYQIWSRYIARCIVAMLEGGFGRIEVRESAFRRYNAELDAAAAELILLTDAGSVDKNYYVNEHGRLQVNSPFESPDFYRRCSEPDWDDVTLSPASRGVPAPPRR